MNKYMSKAKGKKIEQGIKVQCCKIIELLLIAGLLISIGIIDGVNAEKIQGDTSPTQHFKLFNDGTLKIFYGSTPYTRNWAYGISEGLEYLGVTKDDFKPGQNIRTENPNSLKPNERMPHVNIHLGSANLHMIIDDGNVKFGIMDEHGNMITSTEPKTITTVEGKVITLTPRGDKLEIKCNGKSITISANDEGYIGVDEKGNVVIKGKAPSDSDMKSKHNSPKKGSGGSNKKPPGGGEGKSSTTKSKAPIQKVLNGFRAKIGAQPGRINFTEIHGDVSGNYLNLRFVDLNENSITFLSEQSEENLATPSYPYTSLELLLTSIITPDEDFWIDLVGINETGINGTVDMDFTNLGNTSTGWILFNADMSLKLLYYNKYKSIITTAIQNNCSECTITYAGRFWIEPEYINAYVDGNSIFIKNSSMNVKFEISKINASNENCKNKANATINNIMKSTILPDGKNYVNHDVEPDLPENACCLKNGIRQSFRDLRNLYHALAIGQWMKKNGFTKNIDNMSLEDYEKYREIITVI